MPDSVSTQSDPSPLKLSALQLAWLSELGVEKPWLPVARVVAPAAAAVAVQDDQSLAVRSPKTGSAAHDAVLAVLVGQAVTNQAVPAQTPPQAPSTAKPARPVSPPGKRPGGQVSAPSKIGLVVRGGAAETEKNASAAHDLETLSAAIAACQACGLCQERERVVVGQGVMQPAVMVIGEAPGDQEDRVGEPFVGRSGMLLDNMLSAIGSGRDSNAYVANVIKCRPPGNRNPRPDEVAACRPFLMRQIELVKPLSILALGRFAAQTLLGVDAPLNAMREQAYTLPHPGHMVPVVVSYHPSYLLRRPSEKAAAWQDLQRARSIIEAITGR